MHWRVRVHGFHDGIVHQIVTGTAGFDAGGDRPAGFDGDADIDQVMADAADLVEIRHTLRQIVNVKGD